MYKPMIVIGLLAIGSTSAMAGSGQNVTKIISGHPLAPHCIILNTTTDLANYGYSEDDPGHEMSTISVTNSRNFGGIVKFATGDPGKPEFRPSDCPSTPALPITYIHTIER
jgi:hypothetical protein